MPPSAITIPAISRHTATVIMAHGLGDSGAGWVSLAENWRRRQKFSEVKFIFPNAPAIPVSVVWQPISRELMICANGSSRTLECLCQRGTIL